MSYTNTEQAKAVLCSYVCDLIHFCKMHELALHVHVCGGVAWGREFIQVYFQNTNPISTLHMVPLTQDFTC